jgi:hypothetical protein
MIRVNIKARFISQYDWFIFPDLKTSSEYSTAILAQQIIYADKLVAPDPE